MEAWVINTLTCSSFEWFEIILLRNLPIFWQVVTQVELCSSSYFVLMHAL